MNLRLPVFLGIGIGYLVDAAAKITGESLSAIRIQVEKLYGTTYFTSSVINTGSVPPVELEEGLAFIVLRPFILKTLNFRATIE